MVAVAIIGNFGDGALQLFNWTTWPVTSSSARCRLHHSLIADRDLGRHPGHLRFSPPARRGALASRHCRHARRHLSGIWHWFDSGMRWIHWSFWAPLQNRSSPLPATSSTSNPCSTRFCSSHYLRRLALSDRADSVAKPRDEEFRNAQQVQEFSFPGNCRACPAS